MFQNLANYLLGTIADNTAASGAENETLCNNTNLRLISTTADDDWIIVDRDSEGNSEVSSDDGSDFQDIRLHSQLSGRQLLTRTSSSSSLPSINNMEESWFVTPPPCFTSAGPIHMETSPLENLLIEHPSMSVYHQHVHNRQQRYAASIRTVSPPSEEGMIEEEEEEAPGGDDIQVEQRPIIRPNRLLALQQQQKKQIAKNKTAQKVQMQKAYEALKRGNLYRNNKAREVNSRNRRQRRGERSQGANRSHANNNRKC